jgi:hypothetical protein
MQKAANVNWRNVSMNWPLQSFLPMTKDFAARFPMNRTCCPAAERSISSNRTLLSAFRARSGRNAPSNSKFIFGPSVWLRGLIKPAPGYALAYVDWQQQEFGIAAAFGP